MEITPKKDGDKVEALITGRLDAYWADHLAGRIEDMIRDGAVHIRLNLAEVDYVSSAGIRILLKYYKHLKAMRGSFFITEPAQTVREILEMAGFSDLLIDMSGTAIITPEKMAAAIAAVGTKPAPRVIGNATWEVAEINPGAQLACRAIGNPALMETCGFGPDDCRAIPCTEGISAVGLGALGSGFEDCSGRFGEFFTLAGVGAYLPTDGSRVPDYQMASGGYVPSVQALYAIACEGVHSHFIRFETTPESGPITLSALANACFELTGSPRLGMTVVAEAAGLAGAALQRSPASGAKPAANATPYTFPEVRQWLSFSDERAFPHSLVVVTGTAVKNSDDALAPFIRPLGAEASPAGHFHAAAFAYRPVQRGDLELNATVRSLFETATLQGFLHLLGDTREETGGGESEFVRGACWVGPISSVEKG